MKAIKGLVIFMGVLIIAGLGLLGYGMYTKAGKSVRPAAVPATVATLPATADAFGVVGLGEPLGTTITQVTINGGLMAVVIRGRGPDRVHVVDLGQGRKLGTVMLNEAPGGPAAEPMPEAPAPR